MRWFCCILLTVFVIQASAFPRVKRQAELQDSENIAPLNDESLDDEADRDKRMLEGATQAKYGAKNAVLGFVFGKINQLIDAKTRFIDQLDKQNIVQNKMYGIEPPGSPTAALGNVFSSFISPKISLFSGLLGGLSGGGGSHGSGGGGGGLGGLISLFTGSSGNLGAGGGGITISDSSDSSDDDDDDDDDKE